MTNYPGLSHPDLRSGLCEKVLLLMRGRRHSVGRDASGEGYRFEVDAPAGLFNARCNEGLYAIGMTPLQTACRLIWVVWQVLLERPVTPEMSDGERAAREAYMERLSQAYMLAAGEDGWRELGSGDNEQAAQKPAPKTYYQMGAIDPDVATAEHPWGAPVPPWTVVGQPDMTGRLYTGPRHGASLLERVHVVYTWTVP